MPDAPHNPFCRRDDPTPDEIELAKAEIQRGWSDQVRRKRNVAGSSTVWTPPECRTLIDEPHSEEE